RPTAQGCGAARTQEQHQREGHAPEGSEHEETLAHTGEGPLEATLRSFIRRAEGDRRCFGLGRQDANAILGGVVGGGFRRAQPLIPSSFRNFFVSSKYSCRENPVLRM